jgi:hypothetical protein
MTKEFRKIYIISFFFIVFFVASTVFLVIPLIKGIEKDSRDLVSIKGDREFFSEEKSNIEKFGNIYKEIEPNFKKIDNFFVNSEIPVDFISFLKTLASQSNVLIKISPSVSLEKENKNSWPFFNFNLEVAGSFSDFSRFIEKLENSSYLIQVQNLNIRKTKGQVSSSSEESLIDEIAASFLIKVFAK